MSSQQFFSGITVIDFTKVFGGPFATKTLADYGATVIKIESASSPDPAKNFPPLRNGVSGYYEMLNFHKTKLELDLKNDIDRQKFLELIQTADVFVENMTPHVKKNLNIEFATLRQHNPKLIYASLTGIDQQSNRKYFDVIAQAESGLMSLSGTPEQPLKIGPSVVDAFSGMTLAFAVAGALFERQRTRVGQHLEVSMLASGMNLLEQNLVEYCVTGQVPERAGNHDTAIAPFGVFKTQDGQVVLAIGSDQIWQTFVTWAGDHGGFDQTDLQTNEQRRSHLKLLVERAESLFKNFKTDELVEQLQTLNIPCTKIADMKNVAENPWFRQTEALEEVYHPQLGHVLFPGKSIHILDEGATESGLV